MNLYDHTIIRIKTMPIKLDLVNNYIHFKREFNFSFYVTCVEEILDNILEIKKLNLVF